MVGMNRRNTSKEKARNNKGFPYKSKLGKGNTGMINLSYRFGKEKYKLIDESGESFGKFRHRSNALKEQRRLKKEEFRNDIYLETL